MDLIGLLVLILIVWLLLWLCGYIPEPGATIARVIVVVIAIIKLLAIL